MTLTGLILAGGCGSRLHPRKFLLPVGGRPLIERVLASLREVCDEIVISCNEPEAVAPLGLPVLPDAEPGRGPLGGVVTALQATCTACLAVAADMPFVSPELLAHLAARAPEGDVIVPRHGGRYEALHAVYGLGCLQPAQELLASGRNKIIGFYPRVRVVEVGEQELARFGAPERLFFNVNTPEGLARGDELCRPARR